MSMFYEQSQIRKTNKYSDARWSIKAFRAESMEVENPGTLEVEIWRTLEVVNPAAQLFLREVYRQITL